MDGNNFDRITKAFAGRPSRRGLFILFGAVVALKGRHVLGAQLGPATCGASGAVCTLLAGCCDGLTCVTSSINPSYGVCVPGAGGMVAEGTSLISPFSEGVVEEIGPVTSVDTTTTGTTTGTTTDQQAARDARIAAQKARKNSHQAELKTRRSAQQTKRDENRAQARLDAGPLVETELSNKNGVGGAETLVVTNRDSDSITLTKIQSLLSPDSNSSLNRTVGVGSTFNFYSNEALFQSDLSDSDEFAWRGQPICNGTPGAGFRIFVGFSSNSANREYDILCDGPGVVAAPVVRKPKKKHQQNQARARANQKNNKQNKGRQHKSGKR